MTIMSNLIPHAELDIPKLYFSLVRYTTKPEERKAETLVSLTLDILLTAQEHVYFLLFLLVLIISTTLLDEL